MSLPNYLARIKSSGIYRYVWDKSVVPNQVAETLRLVVGYSDKGPFNTPVYIDNVADFIDIFGNISKKMERRGIFFNRMAIQALAAGPILALNLKPFTNETVDYMVGDEFALVDKATKPMKLTGIYDRNRFWKLNEDLLPKNIAKTTEPEQDVKFFNLTATDNFMQSCTLYMRPSESADSYKLTIHDFYADGSNGEMPEYLKPVETENLSKTFADLFVFRGEITGEFMKAHSDYFDEWEYPVTVASEEDFEKYSAQTEAEQKKLPYCIWQAPNSKLYYRIEIITKEEYEKLNSYNNLDFKTATEKLDLKSNDKSSERRDIWYKVTKKFTVQPELRYFHYKLNESKLPKPIANTYDTAPASALSKAKSAPVLKTAVLSETPDPVAVKNYILNIATEKTVPGYTDAFRNKADALEALAADGNSNFISKYTGTMLPNFVGSTGTYISLDILFNSDYNLHKMLMKLDEERLYDIDESVVKDYIFPAVTKENIYLKGYTYDTINNADWKAPKKVQDTILDVLSDEGIYSALTNRVDVSYRYIIDTFQSYIEMGCKSKLAAIAKAKDNAFAILNFPPMQEFVDDNKFASSVTGKFDIKKLADPQNGFSLASEASGASWCGYFTQIKFSDGTVKSFVPSAALVSNNFMEKYGPRQPYYIVAGPNYGRINYTGMVGPDYNYSRADLDVLEPLGVNAIIYVPRKGTFINSNQTAKQVPVSGLSKIHIRELVIFLQDEIEAMLQNYQWELNTQALRNVIKAKADTICERVQNNGGLYAFVNVCDSSNNTPEVIDNEMIVLDTAIEPARGAGKMVQTLTIHKTGGITSK